MHRRLAMHMTPLVVLVLIGCANGSMGGAKSGAAGTAAPAGTAGTAGASNAGDAGTSGAGGTSAGTAGTSGTAGMSTGTGGTSTGGTSATGGTGGSSGGNGGTTGVGASGGVGANGAAGAGGGGTTGGGQAPACAAVTQVNQAKLTLKRSDISAYKYASTPASGDVTKMDYDPVNKVVVLLTDAGKMYKLDPNVTLPPASQTTPVTTVTATEASYTGQGFHRGLAFGTDGVLYILAATGGAPGAANSAIVRKGVAATPGGARTWTTVATTATYPLPKNGATFGHSYSGLTMSPDGMYLYFGSGARSDHGEDEEGMREVPLTSAILRVPANGNNLMLPADDAALKSAGYMFADGTRNTYDMTFNANGDLIGGDNGPDVDLPDELNWLQQGNHYGFPWRFGNEANPVIDPSYTAAGDMRLHTGYQAVDKGLYSYDVSFPPPPTGVTFTDPIMNMGPDADFFRLGKTGPIQKASTAGVAMPGITGHRSPLGLTFDTKGVLCGDFYRQGVLLSYGSLPQSGFADQGQDLLLIKLTKGASAYTMNATQIAIGISSPMDSVLVGNRLFTVGLGSPNVVYLFVLPTP